jgi:NitT/TauT family transport system ATP-binding protein
VTADVGRPAVEINSVSKRYSSATGDVVALQGISIAVEEGGFLCLLGPSGCGKSTLLKLIAGLYPVTAGNILVYGRAVVEPSPLTGLMFQTPVLFPWLTVLDNVLLPIRVRNARVEPFRERANQLIEFVGLAGFDKMYPWQLSGGMQQRAAMCRMLIDDPRLLLMDEPFGALDALNRERLDVEIRSLVARGLKTAVFVTHNVSEAVLVGDRVVVMSSRPGRVAGEVRVALGSERPAALLAAPELLTYSRDVRELLEGQSGQSYG